MRHPTAVLALSIPLSLLFTCLAHAQPRHANWWLGISTHPTTWGYHVDEVHRDSPAWYAGLYEGDYIEAVDGYRIGNMRDGSFYSIRRAFNRSRDGYVQLRVFFKDRWGRWRTIYINAQLDDRRGGRFEHRVRDRREADPGRAEPDHAAPRPQRDDRGAGRSGRGGPVMVDRPGSGPREPGGREEPPRDSGGRPPRDGR